MLRRQFIVRTAAAPCGLLAAGLAQPLTVQAQAQKLPPPRTIAQLAQWLAQPADAVTLQRVRELPETASYTAYLVTYQVAGLRQYALVAQPKGTVPERGFPVLIANRGNHPNPPRYGFSADGTDLRPGDYYREIPALYAAEGFLVVIADYRGHSNSEGGQFTGGFLSPAYYAEDVVGLYKGLGSLPHADRSRVFMWGHSMGGPVTLLALLAGVEVRAASLWSTSGGDLWEQAYHYARYENLAAEDSHTLAKPPMDTLRQQLGQWGETFNPDDVEPLAHIQRLKTPLILQHALGDATTGYRLSTRIATALYRHRLPYVLHSYAGDSHFFEGADRRLAVQRDLRFFRSQMGGTR